MSGCVRHRWYASTGTTADIYPPCPYCRIAELETAVKIERKHAYGDGHMVASTELHGIIQERDARISELEATMDAVLKLIAGAPHEQGCASLSWDLYKRGQCTCWKSKIGSK